MSENLQRAKEIILTQDAVFAYVCGEQSIISERPGIGFVCGLCDEGADLSCGAVADKIVGKAAALLFTLVGVKEAYAHVLSEGGKAVFEEYGIEYYYGTLTESITNRKGDGLCPMENAVKGVSAPKEAHKAVNDTLKALRKQNS